MFTTNIHATEFRARNYPSKHGTFTTVEIHDGTSSMANVFLETPEKCRELIKAAAAAESMLLGETSEPVPESAQDDAGRAIAADLDEQHPQPERCEEPHPGHGMVCACPAGHTGRHVNLAGSTWAGTDAS